MGAFAARWYTLRNVGVVSFPPVGPTNKPRPSGACLSQPCNVLLLGSDSRTGLSESQQGEFGNNTDIGGAPRGDTIMLVHLDPGTNKNLGPSVPRDPWGKNPGHAPDKNNSTFQGG